MGSARASVGDWPSIVTGQSMPATPHSGRNSTDAARSTPGRLASRGNRRSANTWLVCASGYRLVGCGTSNASTRSALKPTLTARRLRNVRVTSVAVTRSNTARAISMPASTRLERPPSPASDRPPCCSSDSTSRDSDCNIGAMTQSAMDAPVRITANASTRQSMPTASMPGMLPGAVACTARMRPVASAIPNPLLIASSTVDSASASPTTCHRVAPSARRTARSCARAALRTSRRPPTFGTGHGEQDQHRREQRPQRRTRVAEPLALQRHDRDIFASARWRDSASSDRRAGCQIGVRGLRRHAGLHAPDDLEPADPRLSTYQVRHARS